MNSQHGPWIPLFLLLLLSVDRRPLAILTSFPGIYFFELFLARTQRNVILIMPDTNFAMASHFLLSLHTAIQFSSSDQANELALSSATGNTIAFSLSH